VPFPNQSKSEIYLSPVSVRVAWGISLFISANRISAVLKLKSSRLPSRAALHFGIAVVQASSA
jgi:hypothetical protein